MSARKQPKIRKSWGLKPETKIHCPKPKSRKQIEREVERMIREGLEDLKAGRIIDMGDL